VSPSASSRGRERFVLGGDVGATKIDLAIFGFRADSGDELRIVRDAREPVRPDVPFERVVADFLAAGGDAIPERACFGVAGPVRDGVARGVNLPWAVDAAVIAAATGLARVALRNDLETTAAGVLALPADRRRTIWPGVERPGTKGVIAAGTGLGQSYLFWDGERHLPAATEGGHVDFAPRDELEAGLLAYLLERHDRVSYERVLSGPGLGDLARYFAERRGVPFADDVAELLRTAPERGEDPNALIGEAGVAGFCPACTAALDRFCDLYGAQAGNLALTVMAIGGIYVAGGIAPKILPKLEEGPFLRSLQGKGRYVDFMREIPVHVVLEPRTSMLGAGRIAWESRE